MGRGADKIVVMDNGLVAEEGTHEALESIFFLSGHGVAGAAKAGSDLCGAGEEADLGCLGRSLGRQLATEADGEV